MTQKEFDTEMTKMNNAQYAETSPLKLRQQEIYDEIRGIKAHISALQAQISEAGAEIYAKRCEASKLAAEVKNINIRYNNLKHEFIMAHPREETVKE